MRATADALSPTAYWGLNGDGTDRAGSNDLTESGTVTFNDDGYETGSGEATFGSTHTNYLDRAPVIAASNQPFTLMALVRYVQTAQNVQVCLASGDDEFNSGGGTALGVLAAGTARFQVGGSALNGLTLTDGQWYLLFGVMNDVGGTNEQRLYVGDVTGNTFYSYATTIGGGNFVDPAARTRINSTTKTIEQANRYWTGDVDEAAIWYQTELSAAQCESIFDALVASGVGASAAPGAGTYADLDWQEAMRARYVLEGGTDEGQEGAEIVALVLGVTNTGEVLGNLQAAGATAGGIPEAVDELLGVQNNEGLNQSLRRLAEEYTP